MTVQGEYRTRRSGLVPMSPTRGLLLDMGWEFGHRAYQRNRTVQHQGDASALLNWVGLQSYLTLTNPESPSPGRSIVILCFRARPDATLEIRIRTSEQPH